MFRPLGTSLLIALFTMLASSCSTCESAFASTVMPRSNDIAHLSYGVGQPSASTHGLRSRHFISRTSAALVAENSTSSDAFVDSIGINAHYESPSYYQNVTGVRALVGNLGVRHYRISADLVRIRASYLSELVASHAAYGTRFNVLLSRYDSAAQILQALNLLPAGSVDSVEGPNENDNSGQGREYDPNFATDILPFMRLLYNTIKSMPAASQVPIIGPSFSNYRSYAAVGNLSNYVDAGNMHDYFASFNPGTLGWGASGFSFAPQFHYGSIDWNIGASAQATGAKPLVATETGYFTAAIHGGVPLDVQAKYVPRVFLEQYRHGISRTFLFQLLGYDQTTAQGSFDIVSPAFAPSPAYTALAGLISLLSEGGRQSMPVPYIWALSGQTANVDHVLLHKVDGTLVLPLWVELPSFDGNANGGTGLAIAVPAQTVTVSVGQPATSGILWTNDAVSGAWSWRTVAITNGTVAITVGDTVSILEIGPSAYAFAKRSVR